MTRPTGDAQEIEDYLQPSIGTATALDNMSCKVPPREFNIGFHGANPGPSHEPVKRKSKPPG